MVEVTRLARVTGSVWAFVERGGTPAMVATCERTSDVCERLGRWLQVQWLKLTPPPEELAKCIERLPGLAEIFEDVREACAFLRERDQLERAVDLADVFASIDESIEYLDREIPRAN